MKQNLTQGDLEMMRGALEEQHFVILDVVSLLEQCVEVMARGRDGIANLNVSMVALTRAAETLWTVRDSLGQAELEGDAEARQ